MAQARKYSILLELLKREDYNPNITEIEVEIPIPTGVATTPALNAVKEKIPIVIQIKKSDFESKYFTTYNYNNFTNPIIDNKIKGEKSAKKANILDPQIKLIQSIRQQHQPQKQN